MPKGYGETELIFNTIWMQGMSNIYTTLYIPSSGGYWRWDCNFALDGNTFSWYNRKQDTGYNATTQLNASGIVYYYIAIGFN